MALWDTVSNWLKRPVVTEEPTDNLLDRFREIKQTPGWQRLMGTPQTGLINPIEQLGTAMTGIQEQWAKPAAKEILRPLWEKQAPTYEQWEEPAIKLPFTSPFTGEQAKVGLKGAAEELAMAPFWVMPQGKGAQAAKGLTKAMEASLKKLGFVDDVIAKMKPQEAVDLLNNVAKTQATKVAPEVLKVKGYRAETGGELLRPSKSYALYPDMARPETPVGKVAPPFKLIQKEITLSNPLRVKGVQGELLDTWAKQGDAEATRILKVADEAGLPPPGWYREADTYIARKAKALGYDGILYDAGKRSEVVTLEGVQSTVAGAKAAAMGVKPVTGAAETISETAAKASKTAESWSPPVKNIDPQDTVNLLSLRQKFATAADAEWKALSQTKKLTSAERAKRFSEAKSIRDKLIAEGREEEAYRLSKKALEGKMPFTRPPGTEISVDEVKSFVRATREMQYTDGLNLQESLATWANDAERLQKNQIEELVKFFELEDSPAFKKPSFWANVSDIINLPKSFQSSMDISAPMRQGLALSFRSEWRRAWKPMLKAFGSENSIRATEEAITSDPIFKLAQEARLDLVSMTKGGPLSGGLHKMEEAFPSRLGQKLGSAIEKNVPLPDSAKTFLSFLGTRPSERAYVTFLNKLRFDTFKNTVTKFEQQGHALAVDEMEKLAAFLNNATGRAALSNKGKVISGFFNTFLFSPQLQISRFQIPANYLRMPAALRKEFAVTMLGTYGTIASLVGLVGFGAAAGFLGKDISVETDSRSSDFGKIKIGNTRIDPWGGNQQWAVFFSRMLSGEYKSSMGDVSDQDRLDLFVRMLRTKASPTWGFLVDLMAGKTVVGEEMTAANADEIAKNRLTPMFINDMFEAIDLEGLRGGLATFPAIAGVGAQTYLSGEGKLKQDVQNLVNTARETAPILPDMSQQKVEDFDDAVDDPRMKSALEFYNRKYKSEVGREITRPSYIGLANDKKKSRLDYIRNKVTDEMILRFKPNPTPEERDKIIKLDAGEILRPYLELEESTWSSQPLAIQSAYIKIKKLESGTQEQQYQAKQILMQYPQILFIRKEIAFQKKQMLMSIQMRQAYGVYYGR